MSAPRRFQVFISSTFEDLRHERQAILRGLLEADYIPAGMELFPGSDGQPWALIEKVVATTCDYCVLVVADRYGSRDDSESAIRKKSTSLPNAWVFQSTCS